MGQSTSGANGGARGGGGNAKPMTVIERAGVTGLPENGNVRGPQMADIVARMPAVINAMQDGDQIQWQMSPQSRMQVFRRTNSDNVFEQFQSSAGERLGIRGVIGRLIPNGTPLVPDMLAVSEHMRIVNGKSTGGIVGHWRVK